MPVVKRQAVVTAKAISVPRRVHDSLPPSKRPASRAAFPDNAPPLVPIAEEKAVAELPVHTVSQRPKGKKAPNILGPGASGPEVIRLQVLLQTAGFGSVEVNGSYDRTTAKAVREFQASRKMRVTGKVTPVTLGLLNKAVTGTPAAGPSPTGIGGGE